MTNQQSDMAAAWTDHIWWSSDGIRLHARLYGDPTSDAVPILCLPGLTRNARDFDALAPELASLGPVAAVDFRGRGDSGYSKDPMTYVPLSYAQDMVALLDSLGWDRFAVVGTSLGGLVAMLLAGLLPKRLAGVVFNDVGPELEAAGLDRIRGSIGAVSSQPTWMHAARQVAEANRAIYPDYEIQDWLRLVHRSHRLTPEGRIVADYDKQIAAPLRVSTEAQAIDMWPLFGAVADLPLLIVRGEHSDILSAAAAEQMVDRAKQASLCTIAGVGHVPTLDEAEARAAIMAWRHRLVA